MTYLKSSTIRSMYTRNSRHHIRTTSGQHTSQFWKRLTLDAKKFSKIYNVPLTATVIFALLVAGATFVRISQRASLADWLAVATNAGKDYGTLLSQDKPDKTEQDDDNSQQLAQAPVGTSTSFAISPNNQPAINFSPSGGTTQLSVFSVAIAYLQPNGVSLTCSTPKPKPQTCSKQYLFNGGIRTQNGPGTVSYSWRSSIQGASENHSFLASNGEVLTPLQKIITLPCDMASTFTLQLAVLSPTLVQSAVLNTNHNCNEI